MNQHIAFLKPIALKGKIRLGSKFDGGYVVYQKILSETDVLFSFGVGWDTAFEEHFNVLTSKPVYMFDPTMYKKNLINLKLLRKLITSLRFRSAWRYYSGCKLWINHLKKLRSKNVHFIQEGLSSRKYGDYDGFDNHKKQLGIFSEDVLLKIDIEGGEYEVFTDDFIKDSLSNVSQLVVEFHDVKNYLFELKKIVEKLRIEFELIHVHGNNFSSLFTLFDFENEKLSIKIPDVIELTLLKRNKISDCDLQIDSQQNTSLMNLDYPNNPNREDYILSFI